MRSTSRIQGKEGRAAKKSICRIILAPRNHAACYHESEELPPSVLHVSGGASGFGQCASRDACRVSPTVPACSHHCTCVPSRQIGTVHGASTATTRTVKVRSCGARGLRATAWRFIRSSLLPNRRTARSITECPSQLMYGSFRAARKKVTRWCIT